VLADGQTQALEEDIVSAFQGAGLFGLLAHCTHLARHMGNLKDRTGQTKKLKKTKGWARTLL
jgi:hypothetical protein